MIYYCPYRVHLIDYATRNNTTIIEEWNYVLAPPPPKLQFVTIDPNTTALLVLDMEVTICNHPRCMASISTINPLLTKSRERGMLVVYSLTHNGNVSDIAPQLSPSPHDPVVKSNVDKFYETDLDQILKEHGIKTVLVTGYAANGAVLHTATSAAFRGYHVIVPVDGISALNPYAEQYTSWHMLNSPGTRNQAVLTKGDWIQFGHPFK